MAERSHIYHFLVWPSQVRHVKRDAWARGIMIRVRQCPHAKFRKLYDVTLWCKPSQYATGESLFLSYAYRSEGK
jgi:hypothetical protein